MPDAWQNIGPYRVLRLIRRGGGGSVYLARDTRLNRRVALKLVAMPRDGERREQVLYEARALAHLNHKSIVQIFDVVESRSHLVLVMEYVPGCDLDELLNTVRPDVYTSLQLTAAICTALSVAHRAGIVHRDLTPANVLLDQDGQVKLGDFGIAHTGTGTGEGAPGSIYAMSPEHASGQHIDQRSDLFSLGLVLYRMLSGSHPFADSESERHLLQAVVNQPCPDLAEKMDLPDSVSALLNKLLAKDPATRPQTAVEVRHGVTVILRSLPLPRSNGLPHLMNGKSRDADEVDAALELPEGIQQGVRSHLFPFRRWGRGGWPLPGPAILARTMGLLLIFGSAVGLAAWRLLTPPPVSVELLDPIVLGLDRRSHLSAEQLQEVLRGLVSERGSLSLESVDGALDRSEPPGEELLLQVRCNNYLCSVRLTRQSAVGRFSNYSALMPDAPLEAWKAWINQGLEQLYPEL